MNNKDKFPTINLLRPKVALNRWRRWLRRTPFVGDAMLSGWIDCAIRVCINGRNDKDGDIYRQHATKLIENFKSSYADQWGG